eukprot:CAMPEP_0180409238 /NCGR_PEP_ID=MMETSP0989-20121125/42726_1 /TAXON_ID=697907 /ORGANISM="non described non described, Strain CCMP2293" /LENGTH=91 /DNA_ID=CAMNT_0022413275 /DNA_START=93 /DNA_END=365 /DNA_ORIENTATION=-
MVAMTAKLSTPRRRTAEKKMVYMRSLPRPIPAVSPPSPSKKRNIAPATPSLHIRLHLLWASRARGDPVLTSKNFSSVKSTAIVASADPASR